jgi:sulfur carrier protein
MKILLNGKAEFIGENFSVTQLLSKFNVNPSFTIVELNSVIISNANYQSQLLKEGDIVELIRFMGGG